MGNNGGGPCGACKFLRRKCMNNCVFAPYFDSDDQGATHFAAVHKVFGASNATKLLLRVPPHRRVDAVVSLCYEALCRVRDPVYGCMANILTLQQQVENLQTELSYIRAQISILEHSHQPNATSIDVLWSPTIVSSLNISSVHFESVKTEKTLLSILGCLDEDSLRCQEPEDNDLEMFAQEFLANYAPRFDE